MKRALSAGYLLFVYSEVPSLGFWFATFQLPQSRPSRRRSSFSVRACLGWRCLDGAGGACERGDEGE
jgi:hypothetical protein